MSCRNKVMTILFLGVIGLGLPACETMEGAGRDVQNAGQSIESAAD